MSGRVGFPSSILLNHWAFMVRQVFGHTPYQVGSSVKNRNYTDVDVVVLLPKEEFEHWFGPHGDASGACKWECICAAFSCWGSKVTGLNIDFKVQEVESANEKHIGPRSALGYLLGPLQGIRKK